LLKTTKSQQIRQNFPENKIFYVCLKTKDVALHTQVVLYFPQYYKTFWCIS